MREPAIAMNLLACHCIPLQIHGNHNCHCSGRQLARFLHYLWASQQTPESKNDAKGVSQQQNSTRVPHKEPPGGYMKNNVYGALMILALAMIVSVAPLAQAQARTRASVPFEFSLDQKSMPAGIYEISALNNRVLLVRNLETKDARLVIESMNVEASTAAGIPHAKMVFHKYGDQYFLAELWNGQSSIGIAFPESKQEKELKWARDTHQPEVVVIAMK
jgi:hypothetical protein